VALPDARVLGAELSAGGITGLVCVTPGGAAAARAAVPAITHHVRRERPATRLACVAAHRRPRCVTACVTAAPESGSRRPASGRELEEIGEQLPASRREDGLRMKLHAPHRMRAVADGVDLIGVVSGPRDNLERRRERGGLDDQ
jgi:hypothetical protein